MSRRGRLILFGLAGPGMAGVLVIGFTGLPSFGDYHGVYGRVVTGIELAQRHATDIVTALNFDIRAFDTLGEEIILFASVTGVALLLRMLREEAGDEDAEEAEAAEEHHLFSGASDALRAISAPLAAFLVALGIYIVVHGTITPGGGFQGGVVLAAGPLAVLVGGRYLASRRLAPDWAIEAMDAAGGAGYALLGIGGLVFASVYLKNFLALGIPGHLLSGGFMPLNSIAVGLEVTGAFLIVWTEFLDQALLVRAGKASS